MEEAGYTLGNLDATIIAQKPKLSPHKARGASGDAPRAWPARPALVLSTKASPFSLPMTYRPAAFPKPSLHAHRRTSGRISAPCSRHTPRSSTSRWGTGARAPGPGVSPVGSRLAPLAAQALPWACTEPSSFEYLCCIEPTPFHSKPKPTQPIRHPNSPHPTLSLGQDPREGRQHWGGAQHRLPCSRYAHPQQLMSGPGALNSHAWRGASTRVQGAACQGIARPRAALAPGPTAPPCKSPPAPGPRRRARRPAPRPPARAGRGSRPPS
jgi:hypothetical protein